MKAEIQPVVVLLVKGLAVCRGLNTSAGRFLAASLWNLFLIDPELTGGLTFPVGRLSKRAALFCILLSGRRWVTGWSVSLPCDVGESERKSSWGSSRVTRYPEDSGVLLVWNDLFVTIQRNTLIPRNCQNDTVWTEGTILLKASPGSLLTLLTLYCSWTVFLIWTCLPGRRPQPRGPGFPFLEHSLDQVYESRNGNTHPHSEGC